MQDLTDRISVETMISARRVQSGNHSSTVIDTAGFESLTVVLHIGEEGSSDIEFNGHYYLLFLRHGDQSDGSDMQNVSSNNDVLDGDVSTGFFKIIGTFFSGYTGGHIDPSSTGAITRIGYRGPKRYVQLFIIASNIAANNGVVIGVDGIKGHARHSQDNAFEIHNA